jgi:hypothetical protein
MNSNTYVAATAPGGVKLYQRTAGKLVQQSTQPSYTTPAMISAFAHAICTMTPMEKVGSIGHRILDRTTIRRYMEDADGYLLDSNPIVGKLLQVRIDTTLKPVS